MLSVDSIDNGIQNETAPQSNEQYEKSQRDQSTEVLISNAQVRRTAAGIEH